MLAAGAAIAAAAAVPAPARAEPAPAGCTDRTATLRALERMTGTHGLTGAAVRVDDPACGTWAAGSGVADRRTQRPMRADLRVRIASVTKTFTAVTVLQLAREGRISLDAPVERYLPGLIARGGYDGRKITVRSLLRHTSGLPDHMDAFADPDGYRFRHFEPAELVERALTLPHPRPGWHYSTTNYVIAGLIAEKASGHSLEDEVQRRIVRPLRLRDTYWPGDRTRIRGAHARGYLREERDGTVRWDDFTEMNTTVAWAGGALVSSPRDLNAFFGALMGGRLLPPAMLAQMEQTVPADPDRVWDGAAYGLGLIGTPLRCGGTWWGHAGGLESYVTVSGVAPSGRRVTVDLNENPSTKEAFDDQMKLVETAFCDGAAAPGTAPAGALAAPPAGALAAPQTGALAAAPAAATSGKGGLARFYDQRLDWRECTLDAGDEVGKELDEAGARCADVTVPLDYRRPEGRTITVAISRLKASDGPHRIGTMIINGGGPGPAIDMPPYMRSLMGEAGPRYDLVGMDPRSLGRSAAVDCGGPSGTWIKSAGESRRSFDRAAAFARDLADRCARTNAGVLPHISTRNIARDMDIVRGALGERKVSYNGASYGTYLGSVYATMFPGRLDRVLLDSSVDPTRFGPRLLAGTEGANDHALGAWAAWAAERDAAYGLGGTRAEVLGTVREVVEASARTPLAVGRYRVDDTTLPVVLFDNLGTDEDGPRAVLAESLRVFARAAAGESVQPTKDLDEELAFLLTGAESVYGSGQTAIICGDAAAPRDPEFYRSDIERNRPASPLFAPLTRNVNPCAFWPARPAERPTEVGGRLPALMVAATGDTRTTYAGNEALHRLLRGSRMVTLDADVHAPYQRGYPNSCVMDTVNDYLLTGRLPARDLTCA
ncbi:CubicO group peptidase, beta-lactamase class C family [Actinomadura mexicana]|uniref:CubicO group peptidase, beta-lactamase class C family n=1 Tax=Actinomadura mexicana TaxID=134959 RepID=A0A238ZN90_9ACTN|nr:CubicO group peptidase, beta-lactamase class C family [Actinomadura mexicana]